MVKIISVHVVTKANPHRCSQKQTS